MSEIAPNRFSGRLLGFPRPRNAPRRQLSLRVAALLLLSPPLLDRLLIMWLLHGDLWGEGWFWSSSFVRLIMLGAALGGSICASFALPAGVLPLSGLPLRRFGAGLVVGGLLVGAGWLGRFELDLAIVRHDWGYGGSLGCLVPPDSVLRVLQTSSALTVVAFPIIAATAGWRLAAGMLSSPLIRLCRWSPRFDLGRFWRREPLWTGPEDDG